MEQMFVKNVNTLNRTADFKRYLANKELNMSQTIYRGITYRKAQQLAGDWKYRQSCNNQPEQSDISKAKAHIYGICAEELLNALKKDLPDNQSVESDGEKRCPSCELYIDKNADKCGVCGLRLRRSSL